MAHTPLRTLWVGDPGSGPGSPRSVNYKEKYMKNAELIRIALTAVGASLAVLAGGTKLAAQEQQTKHSHYRVIDLGTLGGPTSGFNFNSRIINWKGAAVGVADTAVFDPNCGCYVAHGFKWEDRALTDLGPLSGGSNSFAIAINFFGAVAGISENGLIDPVTGAPAFVATIWKNGQIIDLGTFGGSFSLPNDINSFGVAAGGAENTIPDPFDFGGNTLGLPSPTEWHATLWQHGTMRDLGTLANGLDSFALFVNERGQVAGFSFTNTIVNPDTGIPTLHPFLWENGRMIDLGTLGGDLKTVSGLNNSGQVAGTSYLVGDQSNHPFLWERGVLRDLGTLGGSSAGAQWIDEAGGIVGGSFTENDQTFRAYRWINGHMTNLGSLNGDRCSVAFNGNSRGQVVGNSLSDCNHETHAFLWENGGPMVDLNSFVPPGSGILLREGVFINEQGEIAVSGRVANGDDHAFLLVPVDDRSGNSVEERQMSSALDEPLAEIVHEPATQQAMAAFAARSAHRNRRFGGKPQK
jgi:probable HAF family extracellular repeat protein